MSLYCTGPSLPNKKPLVRLKPSPNLVIKIAIANTRVLDLLPDFFEHLLNAAYIGMPLGHHSSKSGRGRTLPHVLKLANILSNLCNEVRKLNGLSRELTSSRLH